MDIKNLLIELEDKYELKYSKIVLTLNDLLLKFDTLNKFNYPSKIEVLTLNNSELLRKYRDLNTKYSQLLLTNNQQMREINNKDA